MNLKKLLNYHSMIPLLMTFAVGVFLYTGCSTPQETTVDTAPSFPESTSQLSTSSLKETMADTVSTVQERASQSSTNTPIVEHDVDSDPLPLPAEEDALSLEGYGAKGAIADQDLSILDMLMYAAQDEYLASGEYAAIEDKFGSQNPYTNIRKAEEKHLTYLKKIYQAYGLDFPEDESADHIVVPINLLEAAKTGVQAEIDNIEMYELFLSYDLPEDIMKVFSALKTGSESHLLAFQKQVDKLD